MSRYRKGAGGKRDENEPEIIKALRAHGCVVWQLSGEGIPDLLVLRAGKKWLADVKMPGKPTTEAQEKLWEDAATKARCAVFILRTPEDAAAMLNNALQPWEPTRPEMGDKDHFHAHAERRCACYPSNNQPRKGDAANARKKAKPSPEVLAALESLLPAYTPPRSTPVDAAKEAEATFAPAAKEPWMCRRNGCSLRGVTDGFCSDHRD